MHDLEAAKAVYAALLGQPHTDQPYYVGFNVDGQEIGLEPERPPAGDDRAGRLLARGRRVRRGQALVAAGAKAQGEPQDVGGGTLMATVTDADGNPIGLIQKP